MKIATEQATEHVLDEALEGGWTATWTIGNCAGDLAVRAVHVHGGRGSLPAPLLRKLSPGRACAVIALRELGFEDYTRDVLAGDADRLRLEVPTGRSYPDEFYRQVACRFLNLTASRVRAPANALAEANDVPVTTVHRWVKEARLRGFLSLVGE